MAITEYSGDTAIISALDTEPNDAGGLTASQLKAKFDEGLTAFKSFFNNNHIPELDAGHLPYDYTVPDGQTVKDAVDNVVLGTIPDSTLTVSKFASSVYPTQAEAEAGEENTKFMNALRTAQSISALAPHFATGSYVGTGTYGIGNKNAVIPGFVAKFILIQARGAVNWFAFIFPATGTGTSANIPNDSHSLVASQGSTTEWYSTASATYQMNSTLYTYDWVALGQEES